MRHPFWLVVLQAASVVITIFGILFFLLVFTGVCCASPISTVLEWEGLDRAAWRVDAESDWQWFAPHQQQPFTAGDTAYQVMLDPTAGFTQALLVLAVEGLPVPLRFAMCGPYLDRPVVLTFYPPEPVQFIPLPSTTQADPPRVPDVAAVPEPGAFGQISLALAVICWVYGVRPTWVRRRMEWLVDDSKRRDGVSE